jgi:hypothetical protein
MRREIKMFGAARTVEARGIAKWCACGLILLAPGSFIVLPLLWLARQWSARGAALDEMSERAPSGLSAPRTPRTA